MDQKKDQPANGQTDQQTNQPNNEPLDGVGASWLPTSAPHAKEQVTSVVRKEGRRDVKGARRQRQYSVTDFDFKWEHRVNLLENQQMFYFMQPSYIVCPFGPGSKYVNGQSL